MRVPISQVDSFTSEPFRGNPAGVCVLPADHADSDAAWMQAVAREMNLAETAFVRRGRGGSARGAREDSESSSAAARASGGGAPRALINDGKGEPGGLRRLEENEFGLRWSQ